MDKNYRALSLVISLGAFVNCFGMEVKTVYMATQSQDVATQTQEDDFTECAICLCCLNEEVKDPKASESEKQETPVMQILGCTCTMPRTYHSVCWSQYLKDKLMDGKELRCPHCKSLVEEVKGIHLALEGGRQLTKEEFDEKIQANFSKYQLEKIGELKDRVCELHDSEQKIKKLEPEIEKLNTTIKGLEDKNCKKAQKKNRWTNKLKDIVTPTLYGLAGGLIWAHVSNSNYPWCTAATAASILLFCSGTIDIYKSMEKSKEKEDRIWRNKIFPKWGVATGLSLTSIMYEYCGGKPFFAHNLLLVK